MGKIILIAGPPGAGKTTVSKLLASRNPGSVLIEGDKFWSLYHPNSTIQKPFRLLMRSMMASALPYAKEGYDALIDFTIPPWFLETAKKIVLGKEVELHYVIICPSQAICSERAATRTEGRIANYDEFKDLYACFDGMSQYHLGNDTMTVEELADIIEAELPSNRFRISFTSSS